MKNLVFFLSLILIGIILAIKLSPNFLIDIQRLILLPCNQPVHYKIGSVDPRFNLTPTKFLQDINQAAQIWDNAEGKNLFMYDPQGNLSINLVYDQRQSLETQVNNLENNLNNQRSTITPTEQRYQSMVVDFDKHLVDLNSEIKYWNQQGGAPPDVYDKIIKEQQALKTEVNIINDMARQLNKSAHEYNQQVDQLDQTIGDLNQAIQNKPEEGRFDPSQDRIDIYLVPNQNELIHTLAHELGHSLGLNHNLNPNSIMYPYTTKKIAASPTDIADLQHICR